jgi:tRNA dimethylallyltransferase
MEPTLVVINGPTAVGKTDLSIQMALALGTEIISTDSRQFYREMSIGTAKPSAHELAQVTHHFINNRSVADYYSAGDFEKEALAKISELFKAGKSHVIAIGGSGLYNKALCEGLDDVPEADLQLRNELIEKYKTDGLNWLQAELQKLHSERFLEIDQNNPQRLMRAIEIARQGGVKKKDAKVRPFKIVKVGLTRDREELYSRINARVDIMMTDGLLEEVRSLIPYHDLVALQTVGYSELFSHFKNEISLDRAIELIKQHSRNYAKKQMTWLRKDLEINWFRPDNQKDILDLVLKRQ